MEEPTQQTGDYISKADIKRERAAGAARRRRAIRTTFVIVVVIVVIALIVGGIWWSRSRAATAPGISYPDAGQEHISLTADLPRPYTSNPPSSGAHYPSPANWDVYDYEVHDRLFIHNLEHGGVWISYKPTVDTHVIEHLNSIVDEFGGSKIVMAPRLANDSDVAVVAWTRVLKFDLGGQDISEEQLNQIRAFYKAHKNRGPEFVPDTMPGVDPKSVQ